MLGCIKLPTAKLKENMKVQYKGVFKASLYLQQHALVVSSQEIYENIMLSDFLKIIMPKPVNLYFLP